MAEIKKKNFWFENLSWTINDDIKYFIILNRIKEKLSTIINYHICTTLEMPRILQFLFKNKLISLISYIFKINGLQARIN